MPLHGPRATALLAWVNSTKVIPDPLQELTELRDCGIFIRIIHQLHRSEGVESILEKSLPERISFIRGFLQKQGKHRSAAENLVSAQELLDGEELALAKVAVLLLYHTSMSSRSPTDWNAFDYETQVELASILRFVLDNEESLDENLEMFLQKKAPLPSSGGSSSEEHSPLLSHKREVRFLELQRIASSSNTNNIFTGAPSSPMGDVLQTPQFQLRRMKKQLAVERENRDELEVELAENRKLLTEKEAQITVMQQRIDRLMLLRENPSADQPEAKEMEELREKNESLTLRLHDALRHCQDLKTEKGQMDRKINQLSEENGDLSFKLREIASHMVQLQEALNELSEEHNAAMEQSQEKQGQLERDLHEATQEKKCSEEKIEILQGKISLLEDQLEKMRDNSAQEKGEVLGDVLKLEELQRDLSRLSSEGSELRAALLRLEEERDRREAALKAERDLFQAEKQHSANVISNLQTTLSESHQARERLERDLQEIRQLQTIPPPSRELEETTTRLEKTSRERDSALQELQRLQEVNATLSNQAEALTRAHDAIRTASEQEKAELSRKIVELEGKILEFGASEGLRAQLRELEGRLKENQQRLAEREKLAKENSRLQERLLFLEESLRNTEGILEDEKRRAAESLEVNAARIAELEAERQQLAKRQTLEEEKPLGTSFSSRADDGERERLEEEIRALSREHGRARQLLRAEQEKTTALEAHVVEHQEKSVALQRDLSVARARLEEKEEEERKLKVEIASLREKMSVAEQTAAQRVAGLEVDARRAAEALEGISQQLSREKLRSQELEVTVERLRNAEKELSAAVAAGNQRQQERETEVKKLTEEVTLLGSRLEETLREHRRRSERSEEETERLKRELEGVKTDCGAERARKAELETQLQNCLNEQRVERALHREELSRWQEAMEEKKREMEELRRVNVSQGEELRDLRKAVSELEGELASARAAKVDNEVSWRKEMERNEATCSKDVSFKDSEEKTSSGERESTWNEGLSQEKQTESQRLRWRVEELEKKCEEQQEVVVTLERAARTERAELEASKKEAAQQKEKTLELQKTLEALRSAQELHEGTVEALRKELQEKGRELVESKSAAAAAEKESVALRSVAQEKKRMEESWKEQIAQCVQELERKTTLMGSLEHEVSILHRQVTEKEGESKELKRLIIGESEKSKKLEERLRVLQTEMATAASRAAERCSLMKVEVQRCQEEMEKQRLTIEALKRDRQGQSEREEELRQEVKVSQEKYLQKEQLLAALRQELLNAQTLAGELPALKKLCHELQAERTALEKRHRQEAEEQTRALEVLQGQLERLQVETAEVRSLRERSSEQERTVQRLQAEAAEQASRLAALRQSNVRLLEEKRRLEEKKLEVELKESEERHSEEMEKLRAATEALVATSRREATEKVEEMRKEYESGKTAALEEKKKMVEEKQKLTAQVEQLETFRKDHVKQVEELQKALTQHEKDTRTQRQKIQALEVELKAEATRHHQKVSELQALLLQKEQTVEHYKGQMEKAKTHYEAKKQQNEDLVEQLKAMEQLQKDNEELRVEAQRLAKELQRSVLRAEEAERRCPRRGGPRPTPPAQMDFAKLRDLADFQGFTDPSENRDISHRNVGELSSDSLELSLEETEPLNSTRKPLRSHSETSAVPSGTKETQRLPRKVESLESLCFTPIPSRSRSRLESGVGKDLSVDSGCKTRSGQRRTTINITMSKTHPETDDPDSADSSFSSASLAPPPRAAPAKSRLRSAASTHFPSRESLGKMETSSPQDNSNDSTLRRLPGYRPLTRSSVRRQHGGSAGDGRSSIFMASCQDEPEPLDDWNRIAELQQRNRSCPPHLKTCYPLEIRPSDSLGTITDEEMKTGDPKETLRRASVQPSQITIGVTTTTTTTRRRTSGTACVAGGVTTRQQRKRLSDESHHGPETPESKKPTACFPRPQTPRNRDDRRRSQQPTPSNPAERRQSLAFSILNTPKQIGSSLLRRAVARKNQSKSSPRVGARRSPRGAAGKSPRGKVGLRAHKDTKF